MSSAPLWGEDLEWAPSEDLEVVIGENEGDERYVLNSVHQGARRLPDGRIAILDGGSSRVRINSPTRTHLGGLGGAGNGPSEFRTPHYLHLIGDTLVYEYSPASLTRFAVEEGFLRTGDVLAVPCLGRWHLIPSLGNLVSLSGFPETPRGNT